MRYLHSSFLLTVFVCILHLPSAQINAQTIVWTEGFEDDWTADWSVEAGTWEVGEPTSGPENCYDGNACAATILAGNYGDVVDSRLIRHLAFTVPDASENPRIRFWHWYSLSDADNAEVQISTDGGSTWETISPTYTHTSSGVWTQTSLDLSTFAGQTALIGFDLHAACFGTCNDVSSGWYVDQVEVLSGSITFNNPESFESGLGDWSVEAGTWEVGRPTGGPGDCHDGLTCAGTVLAGNHHEIVDSRLISPRFTVPDASENPRLRFWQWYSFSDADNAEVQISTDGGSTWETISPTYTHTSSGVWTQTSLDLSTFAGQTALIGFDLHAACFGTCNDVSSGWYIDEVVIDGLIVQPLIVHPTSLAFGDVPIDSVKTVELAVTNSGSERLDITSVMISGTDASYFNVDTTPFGLAADSSRDLSVTFSPDASRTFDALLQIASDQGGKTINLSGTGIDLTSNISGTIAGQTWTKSQSPYIVVGDVSVSSLIIEPGVAVIVSGNFEFEIVGVLTAVGTAQDSIRFSPSDSSITWRGLFFNDAQDSELAFVVVEGATNSGIRLQDSSPNIRNCSIRNNTTSTMGGGISTNAPLILRECIVEANSSTGRFGGGVYSTSTLALIGTRVANNRVSWPRDPNTAAGGGIYASGDLTLARSTVERNQVVARGGTPFLSTSAVGGGIYSESGSLLIENTVIRDNSVHAGANTAAEVARGGGIYFDGGVASIRNSIVSGDTLGTRLVWGGSAATGGGLHVGGGDVILTNVTVAHNQYHGVFQAGGTIRATNSIVYFNGGGVNPTGQIGGNVTITHSNLQDGQGGEGNISLDPVFVSQDDLRIGEGSPSVDSGDSRSSFNDVCLPPSLGAEVNDMGAHGGPGACGWLDDPETGPTAPVALTATAGNGLVTLNWLPNPEPDLREYRLYRDSDPVPTTQVATITQGMTSYTDSDLPNAMTYYYRLTAVDEENRESRFSNQVSAMSRDNTAIPTSPQLSAPPDGVTGLPTSVTLTWQSAAGATSYHLQVATNATFSSPVVTLTGLTAVTQLVTDLTEGSTYFWRVRGSNSAGDGPWSSPSSFTTYPANMSVQINQNFGSASRTDQYRLSAVPGQGSRSLTSTIPGTGGQTDDWIAYHEKGDDELVRFDGSSTFTFRPGNGFWLLSKATWSMSESVATVPLTGSGTYSVPIHEGWNIISNPFDEDLMWSDVQSLNEFTDVLWQYSGSYSQSSTMRSARDGGAYYFFNRQVSSLVLPYPGAGAGSASKVSQSSVASTATADEQEEEALVIRAISGDDEQSSVRVGLSDTAAEGLDTMDQFAPPGYFGTVDLVLINSATTPYTRFAEEYRPLQVDDGQVFDLELRSRVPVTLTMSGLDALGAWSTALIEMSSGKPYDLQALAQEGVLIHPSEDVVRFQLIVGTPAFVEAGKSATAPKTFLLEQNYPNPFNPTTVIEYALPTDSRVRLTVFDALGRMVRMLVAEREKAGWHQVEWDSRSETGSKVSSGVYIYVLESEGTRISGRMILLR